MFFSPPMRKLFNKPINKMNETHSLSLPRGSSTAYTAPPQKAGKWVFEEIQSELENASEVGTINDHNIKQKLFLMSMSWCLLLSEIYNRLLDPLIGGLDVNSLFQACASYFPNTLGSVSVEIQQCLSWMLHESVFGRLRFQLVRLEHIRSAVFPDREQNWGYTPAEYASISHKGKQPESGASHEKTYTFVASNVNDADRVYADYLALNNRPAVPDAQIEYTVASDQIQQARVCRLVEAIFQNKEDKVIWFSDQEVTLVAWKLYKSICHAQFGECGVPRWFRKSGAAYEEYVDLDDRFESVVEKLAADKSMCLSLFKGDIWIDRIAWNPRAEANTKTTNHWLNAVRDQQQHIAIHAVKSQLYVVGEDGNIVTGNGEFVTGKAGDKLAPEARQKLCNTGVRKRKGDRADYRKATQSDPAQLGHPDDSDFGEDQQSEDTMPSSSKRRRITAKGKKTAKKIDPPANDNNDIVGQEAGPTKPARKPRANPRKAPASPRKKVPPKKNTFVEETAGVEDIARESQPTLGFHEVHNKERSATTSLQNNFMLFNAMANNGYVGDIGNLGLALPSPGIANGLPSQADIPFSTEGGEEVEHYMNGCNFSHFNPMIPAWQLPDLSLDELFQSTTAMTQPILPQHDKKPQQDNSTEKSTIGSSEVDLATYGASSSSLFATENKIYSSPSDASVRQHPVGSQQSDDSGSFQSIGGTQVHNSHGHFEAIEQAALKAALDSSSAEASSSPVSLMLAAPQQSDEQSTSCSQSTEAADNATGDDWTIFPDNAQWQSDVIDYEENSFDELYSALTDELECKPSPSLSGADDEYQNYDDSSIVDDLDSSGDYNPGDLDANFTPTGTRGHIDSVNRSSSPCSNISSGSGATLVSTVSAEAFLTGVSSRVEDLFDEDMNIRGGGGDENDDGDIFANDWGRDHGAQPAQQDSEAVAAALQLIIDWNNMH
ncbi:hypothetical protein BX600DRAFT_441451 [Xylariales sp. PMI_506]|nr:hypothetical protein BX600DRAFT_441451 [Xylariales sp. PMI_506]